MVFTELDILHQLDLAFDGIPTDYFPTGQPQDIKYNFFLDLEHGYCETAGSRIHVYGDMARWAIVFEKSGYSNRGRSAEIEINYVGNCIDYPVANYPDRNYITNSKRVILIEPTEFDRIENKEGGEMETFELIAGDTKQINVRDTFISFDNDYKNYEKEGIYIRDFDNSKSLIDFGSLIRYLHETTPELISATEQDIREHIPNDLPKLLTLDKFHFTSAYDKAKPPGTQETYQLIAKVLVTGDVANWKPAEKPNNHWSNWESGNL